MNTTNYTAIDVADATIEYFDFLSLSKKGWSLFEKLYGKPFDIRSFSLSDYVSTDGKKNVRDDGWELVLGSGWKIFIILTEGSLYQKRTIPTAKTLRVTFFYDDAWSGSRSITLENDKIQSSVKTKEIADDVWENVFECIKRRASITIRENKKYLARPAFYDTLEQELNIKVRKKK